MEQLNPHLKTQSAKKWVHDSFRRAVFKALKEETYVLFKLSQGVEYRAMTSWRRRVRQQAIWRILPKGFLAHEKSLHSWKMFFGCHELMRRSSISYFNGISHVFNHLVNCHFPPERLNVNIQITKQRNVLAFQEVSSGFNIDHWHSSIYYSHLAIRDSWVIPSASAL